jgi:YfiH family protein
LSDSALLSSNWLKPQWPAPKNVVALTTTRLEPGIDEGNTDTFSRFNIADHVGDDGQAVQINRQRLLQSCEGLRHIAWLQQTHSTTLIEAGNAISHDADGSFTTSSGVACAVMTADCLPLLICDTHGHQVAAVHAGWRGLAAGIIEKTMATFDTPAAHLMVWLGPAISQRHFEVGDDVRREFITAAAKSSKVIRDQVSRAFQPSEHRLGFYFADIYQLARIRLQALGVTKIYGGGLCSYGDSERFFSYRRDGVCGRMVSLIYKLDEKFILSS